MIDPENMSILIVDDMKSMRLTIRKMLQTLKNSVLFLYGHWWSCKDCSDKIEKVGIKSVFISKKWVENNLSLIPQNSIKITSFTGDNLS